MWDWRQIITHKRIIVMQRKKTYHVFFCGDIKFNLSIYLSIYLSIRIFSRKSKVIEPILYPISISMDFFTDHKTVFQLIFILANPCLDHSFLSAYYMFCTSQTPEIC